MATRESGRDWVLAPTDRVKRKQWKQLLQSYINTAATQDFYCELVSLLT